MQEFIINGRSIKVRPEDIQEFLKGNPNARPKDPREFDKDEFDYYKKTQEKQKEQKIPESPGKSQEASQPQVNQLPSMVEVGDTESSSEDTSSDFVKYTINDKLIKVRTQDVKDFEKGNPDAITMPEQEEPNFIKATLGNNRDTSLATELWETIAGGWQQGLDIDEAQKFYDFGDKMSEEEIKRMVEVYRQLEENGQPESLMAHNERYRELIEDEGYSVPVAFAKAWMENPEAMIMARAQSTAMLMGSAWDNWERTVAAGGTGAWLARNNKTFQKVLKFGGAKGKVLQTGAGMLLSVMGVTSAANETALTTLDLVREQYNIANEPQGKTFADLTNQERVDWYIKVANNKVLYDDLTNRALKRGIAIGMIDAFTGITSIGLGGMAKSTVARSRLSRLAPATGLATTAVAETTGGMVSEYVGQKVAGQTTDPYEILVEGVADKTFTAIQVGKTVASGTPKYTINGETLNGREFDRALRLMDDEAFIRADIKVKNSPTIEKLVTDRTNAVLVDQTVDSRVSDINDRAELIKLKTRQQQIKDSNSKIELAQIEARIQEITNKYANSEVDINVQGRKDAIAFALEGKILDRYNSNLRFAQKNASLYGLEIDDTLTQDQIRETYGEEAANADGFIDGRRIIINKKVALERRAVNVASHELLHGILRKAMVDNPNQFANIREELRAQIGEKQWQSVENRATQNYSEAYMQANPDEWITLTSDAIANGQITYNKGVFQAIGNFITPILRRFGFAKIKFNTGRDVFNFLKEYNESIKKGELSQGIIDATVDPNVDTAAPVSEELVFSKSNLQEMSDAIDQSVPKNITTNEEFLAKDPKTRLSPYDNVLIEVMNNGTLDGYLNNLITADRSLGGVVDRQTLLDDTKFELLRKIRSEYKPVVDGKFRSLFSYIYGSASQRGRGGIANFALGNMKKKYLQTPDASAASLDVTTPEGQAIRQVEDPSQTEADIDTQDLSIARQVEDRKGLFDAVPKGEFVKKIFKFDKATVSTPVRNLLKDTNYDTDSLYEDVAADMVAQVNPNAGVRTEVKPTGVLFAPFEIISQTHFGVNPRSIMAKQQTLSKQESISARTKIAEAIQRTKSAKGLSSVKRVVSSVLPKVNFNPKSEKSIGINTKLLRELYVDGNMRVPNLKGKALNVDRMADTDILRVFGINPDLSLMPYNRTYDGAIKGFVKQASAFAINQETRDIVGLQDATIGIGRPEIMYSKSSKILDIRSLFELETKGIDKLFSAFAMDPTFNLRTENGREQFIQAIENSLLPLMPRDFWFGPDSTVFTASNKAYGLSMSKPEEAAIYNDLRNRLKELRNLPDESFGQPIDGVTDFSISAYSTIFKNDTVIKANIENGKIEEWNNKVAAIHRAMWTRFNEAIRNDNTENKIVTRTIGTYLKLTANDTGHWHKLGAQFTGHSPKLNKYRDSKGNIKQGKYEYEHAMPATAAYLYLMESALNSISNFEVAYDKIIDNYKLIALDKAMDMKLVKAKLQRRMPKGWKVTDFWWQRYLNEVVGEIDGGILENSIVMLDGKTMGQTFGVDRFGRTNKVKHKTTPKQQKYSLSSKKAVLNSIKYSKTGESKGMSTFDFDETLIIDGENFVVATNPNTGETQNIKSGDWPLLGPELAEQGYTFNFDDFVNVRGGVDGPLLQKMRNQINKYGPKNVFVLTARPQTSDTAIHGWLKSKGINIPLKNVTGLGDGRGEAKAQWMLDKFAEGYNDMYFVDDALPNVQAVKTVLDQLDIKSKVVQAKIKFSKTASENFNTILEESQGTSRERTFSQAQAKRMGKNKGWWRLFVPPSAEDFKGLLYRFLGTGRQGEMHMRYFKIKLLDPFAKGIRAWNIYKQEMVDEYKQLRASMPGVTEIMKYEVEDTGFTVDDAIRVYLWDKNGFDIPGIDNATKQTLIDYVNGETDVMYFANTLSDITN